MKGFTLVELLVVISIIAILAMIAITVFSGAQASARDGRRISEISSISKSIEAAKDYRTGLYKYDLVTLNKDFPNGFPKDPLYGPTSPVFYCISTNITTPPIPPTPPPSNWNSKTDPCPSGFNQFNESFLGGVNDLTSGTTTAWTLCASLERGNQPFCVRSLQR